MSQLNLCLLLNLFSNASDALRAARADGRHYVPLSLKRLGRVINTHGDIFVSNAKMGQNLLEYTPWYTVVPVVDL